MKKTKPPTDAFMGMLDLAWEDFKTYVDIDEPSRSLGLVVILIGEDEHRAMTIKTGANIHPAWVEAALTQLFLGMATGTMKMQQVPKIRKRRVV